MNIDKNEPETRIVQPDREPLEESTSSSQLRNHDSRKAAEYIRDIIIAMVVFGFAVAATAIAAGLMVLLGKLFHILKICQP